MIIPKYLIDIDFVEAFLEWICHINKHYFIESKDLLFHKRNDKHSRFMSLIRELSDDFKTFRYILIQTAKSSLEIRFYLCKEKNIGIK